jgi:SAM-dependent methyltransferase
VPSGETLYHSPRVAAGYAFARPPVHPRIIEHLRPHLRLTAPVARALDIGCGAGRSTAALTALARSVVGIDPAVTMLEHRHAVAPSARFAVARAERLPFTSAAFDLITAAGAINYADPDLTLPEIARVLAPGGTFVIYDFSAGRRVADDAALEHWYDEFNRRYPDAPGYRMDVRRLPFGRAGLALDWHEEFSIPIPMTGDAYLRYAMSETRVELAITRGVDQSAIRGWCRDTLERVFADRERAVIFDGYTAGFRPARATAGVL